MSNKELYKSIERFGVKDPVLARFNKDGELESLSGQRRHLIATELNYPVPTIIQQLDDDDAKILDADGNVLVRFADHQLVERQRGSIACVRGQSDCVFLSAENGYTLRLTATDDGTMNIDYAFFTGEESCSAAETILKIPVHRGEVFTVTVTGDEETLPSVVSSTGAVYDLSHNLQFLPDPERILVLPASVRVVEDEAFRGSAAEMIVIPASVTDIGTLAFADCPHLKLVCFERGEVRAAEDILAGCNDSVRIVAPEDSAAARQIEQFRQYLEP